VDAQFLPHQLPVEGICHYSFESYCLEFVHVDLRIESISWVSVSPV
jgi:hypothetical protein